MVGTGRFELPAFRLGGGRSIQLSYVPTVDIVIVAFQALAADVGSELHPFETNLRNGFIGAGDGSLKVTCRSRHAEYTAATGLQPSFTLLRACVEDDCSRGFGFLDAGDDVAFPRSSRVSRCG